MVEASVDTTPHNRAPKTAQERIMIALDMPEKDALALADQLVGEAVWFKVGMTLFYASGARVIDELKAKGFKVFLDLKLNDIPHQVRGAAQSLAHVGADLITVHASGGSEMIRAALEGLRADQTGHDIPDLICITVLTSMNDQALSSIGVSSAMDDQVKRLAQLASDAGAQGIVCSPQEATVMRELLGPDALIVTPGVRPQGSDCNDQSRVMTPAQAVKSGASHLVIGRPITQADDPVSAFRAIVKELEE